MVDFSTYVRDFFSEISAGTADNASVYTRQNDIRHSQNPYRIVIRIYRKTNATRLVRVNITYGLLYVRSYYLFTVCSPGGSTLITRSVTRGTGRNKLCER